MTTNLKQTFSNTVNYVKDLNIAKTLGALSLSFIMGAPSHHHEEHGNLRERRREQGEATSEVMRIRTRSCSINGGSTGPGDDDHEEIVAAYRGRSTPTPPTRG